jgi:hypothetical protein
MREPASRGALNGQQQARLYDIHFWKICFIEGSLRFDRLGPVC